MLLLSIYVICTTFSKIRQAISYTVALLVERFVYKHWHYGTRIGPCILTDTSIITDLCRIADIRHVQPVDMLSIEDMREDMCSIRHM